MLTTEQLREIMCVYGNTHPCYLAAAECLANREAQPVYQYRMRNPYNGQVTYWETIKPEQVDFIMKETIAANVEFRIIAAPPAPANANPVAWEMRYWNSGYNCWHDWERITAEQHAEMSAEHATDNDYEFRVLYDAPPAPGVEEVRR
ncbi:hypothetical protein OHN11_20495 [Serratia marcescens]|uniref:hypothetical protein n=1 Tax=Serratia marcescens TaxID=615 RepID=UPI000428D816|nr:hypothetical protein [Serratia marcescens]MDM3535670.1 hypothetical protein [Serratia marcescens]MDM3540742.1 hypothetical protein [Serratia marcescens]